MLVRTQGGYVNLATITEAVLNEDDSVTLHWGARGKNYYNDAAKRLGFEAAAVEIQDKFLSGDRTGAAAAVPDAFIDATCLVGPADRIRDRVQAWKAAAKNHSVGSLLLAASHAASLRVVAEAAFA